MIKVLQLGKKDWSKCYSLPEYVKFSYAEVLEEEPKKAYDVVFVDKVLSYKESKMLHKATKAYTLFVTENVKMNESMQYYYDCKKGKRIAEGDIQEFLLHEVRNYYAKPYGEKYQPVRISIGHGFSGRVDWNGNYSVSLEGDFGETLSQVVFWRSNVPVEQGQAIDFWLEYEKDSNLEIALKITQFRIGTISVIQQEWTFSEEQLNDVITLDNQMMTGHIFVSLQAKGNGRLKVIALHDRHSRRGHGVFLPGGERYVASNREEIFHYFDPGDLKPPLCVYFSGYKTQQGFEGYFMMRNMGCPYLLIAEPRLSGGCFYMGTEEYEKACADLIRSRMEELGFSNEQVILSGLSMGTFGALYYGCDILPHAMILGKPLASIGLVAENERLHRPGGFPTSLDVLNYIIGDTDEISIQKLNDKFWNKFDATNWGKSKFVISYMIEDDYDSKAYNMLISHLKADGAQLYGKGIHGRHNDASGAIVAWFIGQYKQILREDFSRRIEE